jgi:hypothetical protein
MKTILLSALIFLNLCLTAQDSIFTWNREVAIVSGVIRRALSGWSFVTPDHDALGFSGTITATSNQLTLDMDFDGMGMNPSQWTPSGLVCGADETYAMEGHTFGASVSSTSIVIRGSNNIASGQQIAFNGTAWVGASGYTATWNSSLQCLQLARNLTDNSNWKQGIQAGGVVGVSLETNVTSLTQLYYHAVLVSNSNTQIRIAFFHNGQRVATPDTNMKVFVTDHARRPQTFDFTSSVTTLQPNSNIWIVGTFVKINPSAMPTNEDQSFFAYPNPSNGQFRLSTESNSPIKVYSIDGQVLFSGQVENCELGSGTYIIEQENIRTKVVISK